MNNVKILCTDFEEAVKDAEKGDFIYFDPPYDSDAAIFNSYTNGGFERDEQRRLANRDCYVMLSNYNTSLSRSQKKYKC